MFDIAPSEFLLIAIVAIVVIGPKDLPLALRTAGRWIGRIRRVSNHFRAGIETMIREAEMEEMERKWREQNAAIMAANPSADAAQPAPQPMPLPHDGAHAHPGTQPMFDPAYDPAAGQTPEHAADQHLATAAAAHAPAIDPAIAEHAPTEPLAIAPPSLGQERGAAS
ncbi:Sec-independent protein translocase protein TatB [Novosphingobium sp. FKTRR1]|uniref:Sec-independent protein translocase protein TatB n=1 Tax=Novosphingobium sp. FKTRR1 TaxID=2879118 RepID=UPI001CF067C6|nr:Sec-independent protein translocase protein TatB [Novosphingobium sp. FKTRR1]